MSIAKALITGQVEPAAEGQAALAHENRVLLSRLQASDGEKAVLLERIEFLTSQRNSCVESKTKLRARIAKLEKDKERLDWLEEQLVDDGRYRCAAFARRDSDSAVRDMELELERCGHPQTREYASIRTIDAANVRACIDAARLQAAQPGSGKEGK